MKKSAEASSEADDAIAAPGDAHGRKSEFTEDQRVVQRHVGQHHRDRIGREYLRIGRADVERPEHNGDEREEKAVNAPVRIADRRVADRAGVDDPAQHDRRERPRDDEHDGGQQQQEQDSLLQQRADIRVRFFAVPPCDQNLRSDAEPEPDHENSHVIDSRERRSAQFHFSDAAQESGVGQSDQVLHQQADQDRIGNEPNLFVGRFHREKRLLFGSRFLCEKKADRKGNAFFDFFF